MNKLSLSVLAVGLLLSASAMAQTNTSSDTQKSGTSPSTSTTSPSTSTTQAKPNADSGRLQNDRSSNQTQVQGNQDRRAGERSERRERSGSVSTRSRSTVGIRVDNREFRRHHRGYRTEIQFGHRHCRNIVVKKRFHHRVVVKHIRRCF